MPVIVVANPKGGVGKSTLATNIAGLYARQGHVVMLGDVDRQQSSRQWLALRPEKISMSGHRPAGEKNAVAGTIFEIGYRGETSAYKVRLADGSLMKVSVVNVNARGRAPYAEGDAVWLSWPPDAGIVLTG